jgi:hypothetical protein
MYAITNWKDMPDLYSKADTLKVSENFDDVIVVATLPQGYTYQTLGTDGEIIFVEIAKMQDQVMITTDSSRQLVKDAVAELNTQYNGTRKIHLTIDSTILIDGATTIYLRRDTERYTDSFPSGRGFQLVPIRDFNDSPASTTRGYLNETLLFHGTEKKIITGCYFTAKSGYVWLVKEIIKALDNPIPIKEDTSKVISLIEKMLIEKETALASRIAQIQSSIQAATENMIEEIRSLERTQLSSEVLKQYGSNKKELAIKEIETVSKLDQVERVSCNGERICVSTKPLISHAKDISIYLGRINIEIDIKSGRVLMLPIDLSIAGSKAHPHANSDGGGGLCLGNIASDVAAMIGRYELSSVFSLMLAFAETFNQSDAWGASYKLWPRVTNGTISFPVDFKKEWINNYEIVEGMKV